MRSLRWFWLLPLVLLASCTSAPKDEFARAWQVYVSNFYDNGRIVDTGNNNVSHSEGQGYGMLFAVGANDRERFDALWNWTQSRLQRADKLFSWRYTPCAEHDRSCVDDPNNASDGDILIAWALLNASEKWQEAEYKKAALEIVNAVRKSLIIARYGEVLLLPGEQGFTYPNGDVQVNLSYWVFPALDRISDATGDGIWDDLAVSGIRLIQQSEAHWQLVPDWLRVTAEGVSLNEVVSAEFGFNACRVPLHLAWQNIDPQLVAPFIRYWQSPDAAATINLATNEKAEYAMTPGMRAVNLAVRQLSPIHSNSQQPENLPFTLDSNLDYFSASLTMLSQLALKDGRD